jgi:ArsR family transcriptional regulator, arsenate/arsenite/antimonite-responsive transcriptional repressor
MKTLETPPVQLEAEDVCCPGAACDLLPMGEAESLAVVFKALADPARVRLLRYLAESQSGTACACHLPDALGISQPTLSFHMHKLLEAGLVDRDKRGRWVHWTVRPQALAAVQDYLKLPRGSEAAACC